MTRIELVHCGRTYDLGTYPADRAAAFYAWWRGYCPNRHYVFTAVVS